MSIFAISWLFALSTFHSLIILSIIVKCRFSNNHDSYLAKYIRWNYTLDRGIWYDMIDALYNSYLTFITLSFCHKLNICIIKDEVLSHSGGSLKRYRDSRNESSWMLTMTAIATPGELQIEFCLQIAVCWQTHRFYLTK